MSTMGDDTTGEVSSGTMSSDDQGGLVSETETDGDVVTDEDEDEDDEEDDEAE